MRERRLYPLTLVGEGKDTDIEVGGRHRELIVTEYGWGHQTQFPNLY